MSVSTTSMHKSPGAVPCALGTRDTLELALSNSILNPFKTQHQVCGEKRKATIRVLSIHRKSCEDSSVIRQPSVTILPI